MSYGDSRPINVITVSRGGAPVVAVHITGMHQDRRNIPRPCVGSPATYGSTNAFQGTSGMAAVLPNVTVTRGTGTTLTQTPRMQIVQGGATYYAPQITPQPSVPAFSPPPTTTPSAYLPSPRPRLPPPPTSTPKPKPPSNPPYRTSSDNQYRADSRGSHYAGGRQSQAQGTNSGLQVDRGRVSANERSAAGTPPVDADRRGRYLVGPENFAGGVPIARRYLDGAWGVTPGTKELLGLTD